MLTHLVGIAGRKFVGKDTAAQALVEDGYEVVKFAAALKIMFAAYLRYVGVSEDTIHRMIEGDLKEVPNTHLCGRTPRFFMQKLGTDFLRDMIGEDFHVNAFEAKARQFEKVVCTDVRFSNELERLHKMNGKSLRLYDPDFEPPADEHVSEWGIDYLQTTDVFCNDRKTVTIADLHAYVREFSNKWGNSNA